VVHLTLEAGSRQGAERAAREAMEVMRLLQADYDFRSPGGSVRRINEAAGRGWAEPTPRALALLKRALAISRESDGAFDPTVGALTTAEFYYALAPSLARSRQGLVDYRKVRVDEATGRVRLEEPGMALDLGGIAKGAIIDAAVGALRGQGVPGGIVEAGGDLYCFGDREWKVGIRHPRSRELYATIAVREKAVCGSGDYQQFVTVEDHGRAERLHHIIDPATMEPARASIGTTVIAESAELADALATTVFILGPDRGRDFLRRRYPGAAAVWFDPDRSVARTDTFPR
ncbi:MAG: FAD:protein FMN transferase, partial [Pseudodesulfovibrio sp.]